MQFAELKDDLRKPVSEIDRLSIELTEEQFIENVNNINIAIMGQMEKSEQ